MRNGGTESSEVGLVVGKRNEPCSNLGEVHAQKTAELLLDLEVRELRNCCDISSMEPGKNKKPCDAIS